MRLALRVTNRSVFYWPVNRLSVWEKRVKKSRGPFPFPLLGIFFTPSPNIQPRSQANILQQQIDFAFKKLFLEEKTFVYKASVFTELSCGDRKSVV